MLSVGEQLTGAAVHGGFCGLQLEDRVAGFVCDPDQPVCNHICGLVWAGLAV
uniref:Uncharacterized protein n=1 Tax=Arundo donax TaxID=35708 RepID=A0A0A9BFC2_ARUDO